MKNLLLCALVGVAFFTSSCSSDDGESNSVAYEPACYYCEMINYDVVTDGEGEVCIENGRYTISAGMSGFVSYNTDKSPEQFIAELTANGASCVLAGQGLAEDVCYECIGGIEWNGVTADEATLCANEGVVSFTDASGNSLGSDYTLRSSFEDFLENFIAIGSTNCTLKE